MDATAESIMMEDLKQLAHAAGAMRRTGDVLNDKLALAQSLHHPKPTQHQ